MHLPTRKSSFDKLMKWWEKCADNLHPMIYSWTIYTAFFFFFFFHSNHWIPKYLIRNDPMRKKRIHNKKDETKSFYSCKIFDRKFARVIFFSIHSFLFLSLSCSRFLHNDNLQSKKTTIISRSRWEKKYIYTYKL